MIKLDYSQDTEWNQWLQAGIQKLLSLNKVAPVCHSGVGTGRNLANITNQSSTLSQPRVGNPFTALPIAFPLLPLELFDESVELRAMANDEVSEV